MNLVVVDDDALVALSIKTILEATNEVSVLAVGKNGAQAIDLYHQYKPDVLLMDIRMDTMTGLEAAKHILSKDSKAKILFLTTFSDDEYIVQALRIGAKGYILKQDFESLYASIKAVSSGQSVFGNEIVTKLPTMIPQANTYDYESAGITDKEFAVIELVAEGFSNREISQRVFLSEGTIRNYLSSILEKLDLRDRTQLAVFYYQNR